MRKKPTIKEIARIARVSTTAVSMALNNQPRISQQTRERILRITKELNYQPNYIARSLVIRRSNSIGLIITTIMNPFYPELAKGIEDMARELGYSITFCSSNYDLTLEKYYIDTLRSRGVDGIIFSSVESNDPNIMPLVKEDFPFVLVNRRICTPSLRKKVDYIVMDNSLGAYMAMEHLYKIGHRRIGIVAGSSNISTVIERTEGVHKFLSEAGSKLDPDLIIDCKYSKELAYQAAKTFLTMKVPPTAVFSENDYMVLGVREAILDASLRIPEDMALVGFGDIEAMSLKGVEITTITVKKYEMGSLAVKMLVDKIEKKTPTMMNQVVLEPELIIRESCGYRLHGYQPEWRPNC